MECWGKRGSGKGGAEEGGKRGRKKGKEVEVAIEKVEGEGEGEGEKKEEEKEKEEEEDMPLSQKRRKQEKGFAAAAPRMPHSQGGPQGVEASKAAKLKRRSHSQCSVVCAARETESRGSKREGRRRGQ